MVRNKEGKKDRRKEASKQARKEGREKSRGTGGRKEGRKQGKKEGGKKGRNEASDGERDENEEKSAFESVILELSVLAWEEKRKKGFKKKEKRYKRVQQQPNVPFLSFSLSFSFSFSVIIVFEANTAPLNPPKINLPSELKKI